MCIRDRLMTIARSGPEKVGEPPVRGALRGFARLLAFPATYFAVTSRRWLRRLAGHAQAAWQASAMDGDGGDVTIVDPAPAWRTQVDPSANTAMFGRTTTPASRVSSQELFEQIMREIASSSAQLDDRTRRLRASLN